MTKVSYMSRLSVTLVPSHYFTARCLLNDLESVGAPLPFVTFKHIIGN
jgi:hypothetical protein